MTTVHVYPRGLIVSVSFYISFLRTAAKRCGAFSVPRFCRILLRCSRAGTGGAARGDYDMEFKPAILMYTISDNPTREELVHQLELRYLDALESPDQSTFFIPLLAVNPAEEVEALRQICSVMIQNGFVFSEGDTFKFCCSAVRLNYRENAYEYNKVAVENILPL